MDKTTDASCKEQVSICLRYVSQSKNTLVPRSSRHSLVFMKLHRQQQVPCLTQDVLRQFELYLSTCRGQCFDVCVVVGAHRNNEITLYLNNQLIPCVNKFKYLGINFIAKRTLTVDTASIKRKFYAACNSVLVRGKYSSEIVQVELIKSHC